MSDCIFCQIASGKIPSKKVYEDDKVIAFHDISPQAPVHVLVIPKNHISSMAEINPSNSAVVAHIFEVIAQLQSELKLEDGFRVISNCGKNAGQTVPHLHFHVIGGKELGVKIV